PWLPAGLGESTVGPRRRGYRSYLSTVVDRDPMRGDTGGFSEPVVAHDSLGDDAFLDFAGALADEHEGSFAHEAFDFVFGGVAVAAVDAEARLGDLVAEFAGEVFRHSGGDIVAFAGILQAGGVDHHEVGGFH